MIDGWTAHAKHWKLLFSIAEDIGIGNIRVDKVKAHTIINNNMSEEQQFYVRGNGYADILAKQGAAMHPHSQCIYGTILKHRMLVVYIAQSIARMSMHIVQDSVKEPKMMYDRIVAPSAKGFCLGRLACTTP